jgi:hypothetical protein
MHHEGFTVCPDCKAFVIMFELLEMREQRDSRGGRGCGPLADAMPTRRKTIREGGRTVGAGTVGRLLD